MLRSKSMAIDERFKKLVYWEFPPREAFPKEEGEPFKWKDGHWYMLITEDYIEDGNLRGIVEVGGFEVLVCQPDRDANSSFGDPMMRCRIDECISFMSAWLLSLPREDAIELIEKEQWEKYKKKSPSTSDREV